MRISLLFIALLFFGQFASACDVCGCASSGYMGILPYSSQHIIGLRWQHQRFFAQDAEGNTAYEQFHRAEIFGRYSPHQRIQLLGFLPFQLNTRTYTDDSQSRSNGLGDAMILANYAIIKRQDSMGQKRHEWRIGGGIKAPTGKYRAPETEEGSVVPANFQIGTGSWDFLLQSTYTMRIFRWGMNIETTAKLNTSNSVNYQFGHQFSSAAYAFFWHRWEKASILPYAGGYIEHLRRDADRNYYQNDTGGTGFYALAGAETYVGDFSIGLNYRLPLHQDYANGNLEAEGRWMANVAFLF